MKVNFSKYHGTGNDFIIIDDRSEKYLNKFNRETIKAMCSRHFGIGADGLIILRLKEGYDFQMVYFNSDGNESSMCGNGARAICQFASDLQIISESAKFLAVDGDHIAHINGPIISVQMKDAQVEEREDGSFYCDTGSPHYIKFTDDDHLKEIVDFGRTVRYSPEFSEHGVNVNLVSENSDSITVATYERGVEDETLSCGTGVTASALVSKFRNPEAYSNEIPVHTKGGDLSVSFVRKNENTFSDVFLSGPAIKVFDGVYSDS